MSQDREKLLEMTESSALRVLDELESLRAQMIARSSLDPEVIRKFEELERTAWSLLLSPISRLREDFLLAASQYMRERKISGISFGVEIEEIWVPQPVFLALLRALTQFLRNSFAHAGLKPGNRIEFEIGASASGVRLTYRDDGQGPDWASLQEKTQLGSFLDEAVGEGLEEEALLRNPALLDKIFSPGVSTAGEADLSAGRGMGLTSVRSSVHELGGTAVARAPEEGGLELEVEIPLEFFGRKVRPEQESGRWFFRADEAGSLKYFRKVDIDGEPSFAALDWRSGWVRLEA